MSEFIVHWSLSGSTVVAPFKLIFIAPFDSLSLYLCWLLLAPTIEEKTETTESRLRPPPLLFHCVASAIYLSN
jgi:hypothetical protein